MDVHGLEGLSNEQLNFEIQSGGRFVMYSYCVSVIFMTFKRPSPVYFIRSGENAVAKGLPWSLLTFVLGWWGIPWGPIYSIQALVVNFKGGRDVTAHLTSQTPAAAETPLAPTPIYPK